MAMAMARTPSSEGMRVISTVRLMQLPVAAGCKLPTDSPCLSDNKSGFALQRMPDTRAQARAIELVHLVVLLAKHLSFLLRLQAETGERLSDVFGSGTLQEARPEVAIHGHIERFVQAPHFLVQSRSPEGGG